MYKYNRILTKITACTLMMVWSSCNGFLDIPKPNGDININNLKSIESYENLLNGVYNGLQNYAGRLLYLGESMTDYVDWNLSFTPYRQVGFQSMEANNEPAELIWNQLYKSINEANIIIADIGNVNDGTEEERENVLGQAYFMRAMMYYYLVQYYAKPWDAETDNSQMGVPLRLKPVITDGDFEELKRASVKEVYDQIISDLKSAGGHEITNTSPSMATKYTVLALQARIALIQQRWKDAAEFAKGVIPHYTLLPDVQSFFRDELGAESIFEIVNLPSDVAGGGNYSMSVVHNIDGRAGVFITDTYRSDLKKIVTDKQKEALEANNEHAIDTRVTELLATRADPPLTIDKYTHTNKYEDGATLADNIPIFRLPEMMLTRAEALAELDDKVSQEAIDLLNEVRTRAVKVVDESGAPGDESLIKFTAGDFQNKDDLVQAIFLERSVELSYEGHRKTDLQRKKMDVRETPWDADKLVFPIPQSQTDVSDIEQNPGY